MTHRFFAILVPILIWAVTFATSGMAESRYLLQTAGGAVELKEKEGKVFLSGLTATFLEGSRAWVDSENPLPLWTVAVQSPDGNRQNVTALDGPCVVTAHSKGELELVWKDLQPGYLRVVVTLTARGEDLVAGFSASVHEEDFFLWDVTFPEIGPISLSDKVYSIEPYGWGVIHHDLMNRPLFEATYPSCVGAMAFIGLSDGETGVYLGVENPSGHALRLFVGRPKKKDYVSLGLRHDVEGMGATQEYRVPYDIVLTPFRGDWYEAARLYRKAALKTPWGSVPALTDRTDIPKWLLDTDLWYIGACHDATTAQTILDFAKYFEVPTSAHIYNWHEIPFDDHYPEYFPAKPGFKSAVEKVQNGGVHIMPYINGRLWDPATDSWRVENASSACALDERGKPYVEVYGSKVPLSPMCPSTELWKRKVVDLVDRLINEVGVDAVYIDQISAAAAKRCFAENHGHPKGGGNYWVKGYRDLIQRCREVLPPGKGLTTEENADPWNDLLDAFLLVNTKEKGGEMVPLYPAVYGGRVISFGLQYFTGEDFEQILPLRLKFARTFVFGSQMGWIGSGILNDKYRKEAEFLKRLCHARNEHRDALQFGELLPPVELEGVKEVSWAEKIGDSTREATHAAVLASVWLTPEGVRKLALANISEKDQAVTVKLRQAQVGETVRDSAFLAAEGRDRVELTRADSDTYEGRAPLQPLSAAVYRIE